VSTETGQAHSVYVSDSDDVYDDDYVYDDVWDLDITGSSAESAPSG
jgi:hypothetical protein